MTLQIKALEDDLGVRLFDRTAGRVSLTPQGMVLLRHAQRILQIISEAEQELAAGAGQSSGELALGVSTTIAQYVLPRLISAFLAEHPGVQLSLRSGNSEEIVQLLLQDKASIGLIEGPSRHREVGTEPFMEDEMVLIAPGDFDRLSRARLLGSTLLMREPGSGSRRVVETALQKAGFKLKSSKNVIHLDSTETIQSAVEAGLGVGIVSRWAIAKELELRAVKIVEVAGRGITRDFSLVARTVPNRRARAPLFGNSRWLALGLFPARQENSTVLAVLTDKFN